MNCYKIIFVYILQSHCWLNCHISTRYLMMVLAAPGLFISLWTVKFRKMHLSRVPRRYIEYWPLQTFWFWPSIASREGQIFLFLPRAVYRNNTGFNYHEVCSPNHSRHCCRKSLKSSWYYRSGTLRKSAMTDFRRNDQMCDNFLFLKHRATQ